MDQYKSRSSKSLRGFTLIASALSKTCIMVMTHCATGMPQLLPCRVSLSVGDHRNVMLVSLSLQFIPLYQKQPFQFSMSSNADVALRDEKHFPNLKASANITSYVPVGNHMPSNATWM